MASTKNLHLTSNVQQTQDNVAGSDGGWDCDPLQRLAELERKQEDV